MKTMLRATILVALLSPALTNVALSQTEAVAPAGSMTTTVHGMALAAFHFDVSSLEDVDWDGGRAIYFEWTLTGVPSNERSEFAIYEAGDGGEDSGGVAQLELGESPADTWDIEIRDYERAGGFVRLNVTDIVRAWLSEDRPNHGLVFTTTAVSANTLGGQFSGARLVLR